MLSIDKSLKFEGLDNFFYVANEKMTNTILLVDDEINNIQLLKRALRGKYNILTASQGQEGLDILKEHIEDREKLRMNTWQSAMYQAIIDSDWFWEEYMPKNNQFS